MPSTLALIRFCFCSSLIRTNDPRLIFIMHARLSVTVDIPRSNGEPKTSDATHLNRALLMILAKDGRGT